MDSLLRNVRDALRPEADAGRDRRRAALRRALECDTLEGRQLLSAGFGGAGLERFRGGAAAYAPHGAAHHGGARRAAGGVGITAPWGSPTLPTTPPTGQTAAPTTPQTPATPTNTTSTDPSTQATSSATTPATNISATPAATTPAAQTVTNPASQPPASQNPQFTADLQKLQKDTHAILAKSQVTVAETVALHDDLQQINKEATSAPSQATVQALQTDVKALQGALPTAAQMTQLTNDFTALVQSRGVTDQTLISKTVSDAQAILTSSGITSDDLSTIAADHKATETDLGKTPPTTSSTTSTSGSATTSSSGSATTSSTTTDPNAGIGDFLRVFDSLGGGLLGGPMGGAPGGGSFRGFQGGPVGGMNGGPMGGWQQWQSQGQNAPGSSTSNTTAAAPGAPSGPAFHGPFGRFGRGGF